MLEYNQIYNGDCLEVMEKIDDQTIDMILCDLPYGCTHNKWDSAIDYTLLWKQYERIIKDNGAIVLFGQGLFTHKLAISNEKLFRYNLVYKKKTTTGFLNANRMPLCQHEDILVFYKKLPTYNPQFIDGKPYTRYGSKNRLSSNYGYFNPEYDTRNNGKRYPKSIIEGNNCGFEKNKHHPTEKPLDILQYLIRTYTNPNEIVLDNCCGGGNTLVASINENRQFIGIEKEVDYYNTAKMRVNELRRD